MATQTSRGLRTQARETILELLELASSDEELPATTAAALLISDDDDEEEEEYNNNDNENDIEPPFVAKYSIFSSENSQSINESYSRASTVEPLSTNYRPSESSGSNIPLSSTILNTLGLALPGGGQIKTHSLSTTATSTKHLPVKSPSIGVELEYNGDIEEEEEEEEGEEGDNANTNSLLSPLATKPAYKRRAVIPDSHAMNKKGSIVMRTSANKNRPFHRTNIWFSSDAQSAMLPEVGNNRLDPEIELLDKQDKLLRKMDDEIRRSKIMEDYLLSKPSGRKLIDEEQQAAIQLQHDLLKSMLDSMSFSLDATTVDLSTAISTSLHDLAAIEALLDQSHEDLIEHDIDILHEFTMTDISASSLVSTPIDSTQPTAM
ncbi:hypothetical protein BDF19DRAFT_434898 [Syncephalis fuscata]|nr:hypothetical protein BDF19DRAFT_434898 [Syncephalis fuscata]